MSGNLAVILVRINCCKNSIKLLFICSVIGYTLLLSLIEYKTLVMRGDLEQANEVLPSIPKEQLNRYYLPLMIFKNGKMILFLVSKVLTSLETYVCTR